MSKPQHGALAPREPPALVIRRARAVAGKRAAKPAALEHAFWTATLCLLAFGAVMVYKRLSATRCCRRGNGSGISSGTSSMGRWAVDACAPRRRWVEKSRHHRALARHGHLCWCSRCISRSRRVGVNGAAAGWPDRSSSSLGAAELALVLYPRRCGEAPAARAYLRELTNPLYSGRRRGCSGRHRAGNRHGDGDPRSQPAALLIVAGIRFASCDPRGSPGTGVRVRARASLMRARG